MTRSFEPSTSAQDRSCRRLTTPSSGPRPSHCTSVRFRSQLPETEVSEPLKCPSARHQPAVPVITLEPSLSVPSPRPGAPQRTEPLHDVGLDCKNVEPRSRRCRPTPNHLETVSSAHYYRRHRHRARNQNRAMRQVAEWIERSEQISDLKGADDPSAVAVQQHVHHFVHEHHHYHYHCSADNNV
jgi:hypothetical protein